MFRPAHISLPGLREPHKIRQLRERNILPDIAELIEQRLLAQPAELETTWI
jgi:hypothetical protein